MPTAKPRITVTLEPRAYEVLSRLSAVGRESMSSLVAQFVDASLPSLERLVVVLERAKAAPKETVAGLARAVERAERQLLPALMNAQDMGDLFLADLETSAPSPAPAVRAQRARPVAGASRARKDPRLVTRGSGGVTRGKKGVKRG